MDSLPEQPEKKQEDRAGVLIAARWLKEQVFAPQKEPAISSLGEFILPVLLGIMESCWLAAILIGLASIGLFSSSEPLMPLWAPFLLIVGSILLFYFAGLRTAKHASSAQDNESVKVSAAGAPLFIIITSVLALFFTWLHLYADTFFVFDPKWLLALLNDILLLKEHFYEVVLIVGLAFFFGWRAIRLLYRPIKPSNGFRSLCLLLSLMILFIS